MYVSSFKDGIVDSLRMVSTGENFSKPYSDDHRLAVLFILMSILYNVLIYVKKLLDVIIVNQFQHRTMVNDGGIYHTKNNNNIRCVCVLQCMSLVPYIFVYKRIHCD